MTPKTFFSIFAVGEAITWALLLLGMFLKYVTETTEAMVSIGGSVHGFMFIAFVAATVFVTISQRWSAGVLVLGLVSAVVPFATVPFEWWATRRGLLDGAWRLRAGGEPPRNGIEKLVSWSIRRPVTALLVGVVAVAAVFTALMLTGPPV